MHKQNETAPNLVMCALLMPEVLDYEKEVSQDLRFAVIGFGKMGILHSGILNLLRHNCVKIVVDNSRLLTFGASRLIKNVTFCRDLNKLLKRDDFDAVYVTTPPQSHYAIVSKLLETGVKYVFVEKPPTVNSRQIASLVDKMEKGQVVMAGLQKRFALPFRHAKLLISEKVVGDVEKVSAHIKSSDIMVPTSRFKSLGRGVNLDLGIHLIDLLVWIFNVSIVKYARCGAIYSGVDDYFEAILKNEDNVEFSVEVTWSSPAHRLPETCIEVYGSKGELKVTEDCLRVRSTEDCHLPSSEKELTMYKPHYYQDTTLVNLADPEYTLENMHFIHSISKSIKPLTDLRNLTKVMSIMDEMYKKAGSSISSVR